MFKIFRFEGVSIGQGVELPAILQFGRLHARRLPQKQAMELHRKLNRDTHRQDVDSIIRVLREETEYFNAITRGLNLNYDSAEVFVQRMLVVSDSMQVDVIIGKSSSRFPN